MTTEIEDDEEFADAVMAPSVWRPASPEQALRWDCLITALGNGATVDKAATIAGKFEKFILGTIREVD